MLNTEFGARGINTPKSICICVVHIPVRETEVETNSHTSVIGLIVL